MVGTLIALVGVPRLIGPGLASVGQPPAASTTRVTLSEVTATLPGRARATVTYYYRDGRVDTEPTVYPLVPDGGTLKINSSTVLSSSSR